MTTLPPIKFLWTDKKNIWLIYHLYSSQVYIVWLIYHVPRYLNEKLHFPIKILTEKDKINLHYTIKPYDASKLPVFLVVIVATPNWERDRILEKNKGKKPQ